MHNTMSILFALSVDSLVMCAWQKKIIYFIWKNSRKSLAFSACLRIVPVPCCSLATRCRTCFGFVLLFFPSPLKVTKLGSDNVSPLGKLPPATKRNAFLYFHFAQRRNLLDTATERSISTFLYSTIIKFDPKQKQEVSTSRFDSPISEIKTTNTSDTV